MKKQETGISALEQFLPANTFDMVAVFFKQYTIHLTLTRERKSILGDYRNPTRAIPHHQISININLNRYSFLITLLHEIAHLTTFDRFKHTVAPHGAEWKAEFRQILIPFLGKKIFPPDVEKALVAYIHNPAASTCSDTNLFKALYKYDERKTDNVLVDDVATGQWFEASGRTFEKLEQLRTRSRCKEIGTGKVYLFQGIYEVKLVEKGQRRTA